MIGNSAYPGIAALKNPANDAKDMAAALRKLGFDVIVKTNVSQKDMLRALTELGDRVRPGAEVLFFYAGHGMQVRGRNYLIPVDAEIRTENAVSSEAVDVDQLLDKLAGARLSMVILDACRNNPFERRFRGGGQGLASINAPTGTLIAYATAPGKVAADGDGRNGLYTQELLAAINVPGIKVEDVFKRVRTNVVRKSSEVQVPWESSSLTGDFYFRPAGAPAAAVEANQPEVAFWNSAERSNETGDYEAYLKRFPDGLFSDMAKSRIAMLKRSAVPAPDAAERAIEAMPKLHAGDNWQFTNMSLAVERVGDDGNTVRQKFGTYVSVIQSNREGNPVTVDTEGSGPTVRVSYSPALPVLRFPLKPGKSWREPYKSTTKVLFDITKDWEYEAKVAGWETIKVSAGSFEALRIDWRIIDPDNANGSSGTSWYSPDAKGVVKYVNNSPRGGTNTVELLSFTLKPD